MKDRLTEDQHRSLAATLAEASAGAARAGDAWRRTTVRATGDPLGVDYDWASLQPGRCRAWLVKTDGTTERLKDWQHGDYRFSVHGLGPGDAIQFEIETFATAAEPYQARIGFTQAGQMLADHIAVLIREPRIQVERAEIVKP